MSLSKLSAADFSTANSRLQKAQANRTFSIDTTLFSPSLVKLVNAHADAIGVSPEFIFWPLLTATASMMGTSARIKINPEWCEPAIIWFVIAARKGEKKTAALRRISRPIMDLQKKLHEAWKANDDEDKLPQPPQLIIDHFSFEELHTIMCRNRGQILGLFDEMSSFYGQLDLYKHSSTMDRKTLLTLNGGGSWARNYKSYSASMDLTSFNVTGFIQPAFVYEMLNLVPDADGLNDRQLFDFPPERELHLDELKVPMASDTPDLLSLFSAVYDHHTTGLVEYHLQGEAFKLYEKTHDELVDLKINTKNENAQGILSKARGYCARIAMVIHCLEQALERIDNIDENVQLWELSVTPKAVEAAAAITHHLNHQKFQMLGIGCIDPTENNLLTSKMMRLLSAEWRSSDGTITPAEVSQKHISEKVGASYPSSKALDILRQAESLGYGEMKETTAANKRVLLVLKKKRYRELSIDCVQSLKKVKLSEDNYSKCFDDEDITEE